MRLASLVLCLSFPAVAFAQSDAGSTADRRPAPPAPDAGPDDAASAIPPPPPPVDAGMPPMGCGMITPEGECNGTVLSYCDQMSMPEELIVLDCAMDDPRATCIIVNPTYGADCAAATGDECIYADNNGDLFQGFCQGAGAACVEDANGSACIIGEVTCTDADVETCRGDRAVITCSEGQPWLLDCVTYGGTCSAGGCVGIPEGGFCGDGLECAQGLACDDQGECAQPVMGADAGTMVGRDATSGGNPDATSGGNLDATSGGNADAGTTGRADASSTARDGSTGGGGNLPTTEDDGCAAVPASTSALWAVLAGLALLARRRR